MFEKALHNVHLHLQYNHFLKMVLHRSEDRQLGNHPFHFYQ